MNKLLYLFVLPALFLGSIPSVSSLTEAEIKARIGELVNGGNSDTLRVLYLGNSRVARPTGFAFDGPEEDAFEQGRLAGNGFVVPFTNIGGSSIGDNRYLINKAYGMTNTPAGWKATDAISTQHDLAFQGLALVPGRVVKMSNLRNVATLLFKDQPATLTVQYLVGPGLGTFRVTPVEVQGKSTIAFSHPKTVIGTKAAQYGVGFTDVILPPMQNTNLNRAFTLTGVSGNTTVYRVNVLAEVPNGIAVSEMAIGGKGYPTQADETILPAASWTAYAAAYEPDIVLYQFAANQGLGGVADATRELMDRINSVNPNAIHVILTDNPAPRSNTNIIVGNSVTWAKDVVNSGYENTILIDMTPYLPQDFLDLAGTCATQCQFGSYFADHVHENRLGARVVWDAISDALEAYSF